MSPAKFKIYYRGLDANKTFFDFKIYTSYKTKESNERNCD